jgi:hypothetical protein
MEKKPLLIDLPKPSKPSVPLLEKTSESVSDNTVFYVVIGVIALGFLYYVMKNDSSETTKSKFVFPNLQNVTPIQAIVFTHKVCPVLGTETKNTACFQYPPLSRGFVISFCCNHCAEKLQKSFNDGDGEYTIKEENNMNILYHNDEPRQVTPVCSQQNVDLVVSKVGTKIMKGDGNNN